MIILISALLLIIILLSALRTHIHNSRQIHVNAISEIYDKMEVYVYQNNLHNKKEVISYILPLKNLVVNSEYTDIEIILASLLKFGKQKKEMEKLYAYISESVPLELKEMSNDFYIHAKKLVRLSIWRMEPVFFFTKLLISSIAMMIFKRSLTSFKNMIEAVRNVFNRNSVILSSDISKMNTC